MEPLLVLVGAFFALVLLLVVASWVVPGFSQPRPKDGLGPEEVARVYRALAGFALADGQIEVDERQRLTTFGIRHGLGAPAIEALERQARQGVPSVGPGAAERAALREALERLVRGRGSLSPAETTYLARLEHALDPDGEVDVAGQGTNLRCVYCHDGFAQGARRCVGCGALLHAECWEEAGGCPTPSCRPPTREGPRERA